MGSGEVQVDEDVFVFHVLGGVPLAAGVDVFDGLAVGSLDHGVDQRFAHGEGSLGDGAQEGAVLDRGGDDSAGVEARADDLAFAGAQLLIFMQKWRNLR